MATSPLKEHARTFFQVLAVLCLAGIILVILHKAYTDMTALSQANRGHSFWPALVRYIFRTLAG
jgi:hypothetical protein